MGRTLGLGLLPAEMKLEMSLSLYSLEIWTDVRCSWRSVSDSETEMTR